MNITSNFFIQLRWKSIPPPFTRIQTEYGQNSKKKIVQNKWYINSYHLKDAEFEHRLNFLIQFLWSYPLLSFDRLLNKIKIQKNCKKSDILILINSRTLSLNKLDFLMQLLKSTLPLPKLNTIKIGKKKLKQVLWLNDFCQLE